MNINLARHQFCFYNASYIKEIKLYAPDIPPYRMSDYFDSVEKVCFFKRNVND